MWSKFLLVILIGLKSINGELDKEEVNDGACITVPGDPNSVFFLGSPFSTNWYMYLGSEYAFRYTAEVLNDRKATGKDEMIFKEPLNVVSMLPLRANIQIKDKLIQGYCPTYILGQDMECVVRKTTIPEGKTYSKEESGYNWKVLGKPKIKIFKVDKDNQYALINICSSVNNKKFWIAVSKVAPITPQVIEKIKSEVKPYYPDLAHFHAQEF